MNDGNSDGPRKPLPAAAAPGEGVGPAVPPVSHPTPLPPAHGGPARSAPGSVEGAPARGAPLKPELTEPELTEPELTVLHCVFCGSTSLHESDHAGFAALMARAGGATVFTCLSCRHRFAVRLFERIHGRRRRHRDSQSSRDRRMRRRRQLFYWIWILLGAVLTAFAVYYFLERDTQRSLAPQESSIAP